MILDDLQHLQFVSSGVLQCNDSDDVDDDGDDDEETKKQEQQ